MERTNHQRGNESGVLFFDGSAKQISYRSWLGNCKVTTDLRLSYESYDWVTIELRKPFWPLQKTWKSYDWLTKTVLAPSKNVNKLRLTYENRFGPFKKRKQVTIDLRFPFWALQKTQKNYDWLTIELRWVIKVIFLTYESYKWVTRNFYNFYKSEI